MNQWISTSERCPSLKEWILHGGYFRVLDKGSVNPIARMGYFQADLGDKLFGEIKGGEWKAPTLTGLITIEVSHWRLEEEAALFVPCPT